MDDAMDEDYLRCDLENIEEEMRMERIRQSAARHNWAHFNDVFYKNLMDKRIRLDANDKEDWQSAIQFLKKHMPCDDGRETSAQLRYLAEHIECDFETQPNGFKLKSPQLVLDVNVCNSNIVSTSISCFGGPMKDAPRLTSLMASHRWGTVLSSLSALRGLLPLNLNREEKEYCLRSLEIVERDLLDTSANNLPVVDKINKGVLGLCQPRSEISPFTIHLVADPKAFFDVKSPNLFSVNEEALLEGALVPCARLCVSSSSSANLFPDRSFLDGQGKWVTSNTGRSLSAAFCLRFARPIIFCAGALKKLSELCTGELKVAGGLNIYRYLMGNDDDDDDEEKNTLIVKLPGCVVQRYELDESMTATKEDGIVEEVAVNCSCLTLGKLLFARFSIKICFAHPRDAIPIVSLVRSQLAHNFLFESLVRAHYPTACTDGAVPVRLTTSALHNYELVFQMNRLLYIARVQVLSPDMKVTLETIGGGALRAESQHTTMILSKTWSLALMLRSVLRRNGLGNILSNDHVNVMMKDENVVDDNDVKLSQCWSSVSCNITSDLPNRLQKALCVRDEEDDISSGIGKPISLLSIFKEIEIPNELIPPVGASTSGLKPPITTYRPGETALAPRNVRLQSENTLRSAVSEQLKELCDMAEAIGDPESEHSGRSPVVERRSPSMGETQRIRSQLTPQPSSPANDRFRTNQVGGIQQLSPLEIARQRLAQNPSDVFEFDPPRITQSSAFPNSSQFHFPGGAQNPYPYVGVQPTRGLTGNPPLKRRRGRKAANIGDRTVEHSASSVDPVTGLVSNGAARRPRGTGAVRRPRRPRKATQLAASQAHTHQFPGPLERPMLQRSFSEMQYSTQSSQAGMISSVNRMNTVSGGEGLDGSSDDEVTLSPSAQSSQPLSLNNLSIPTTSSQHSNSSTPLPYPSPSQYNKLSTATGSSQSSIKSGTGSTGSNTPVAASPSPSITPAPPANGPKTESSILKPRKSPKSLEAVVGKLHNKSSPSIPPTVNPYAKSDLYDDESGPSITNSPLKTESPAKLELSIKSEQSHHSKRESPPTPANSTSPSSRNTANAEQPQAEQLKLILKVKPPVPSRSSTPSQYTSNISPPPSRLIGQPPSSSRSKEEKALARQKQARANAKREEERIRKVLKREKKEKLESSGASKKPKLDRFSSQEKRPSATEFPAALNFASLKNFKIPKVIENEKNDTSQQSNTTTSSSSNTPSTSVSSNTNSASNANSSNAQPPPMHQVKPPKSILKNIPETLQPPMPYRMGIPPMLPARKSLLPHPDPRVMQYPPRPMGGLPFTRHLQGGVPPQPPPPSTGRWMSLAPPKHNPSSRSPNLEQNTSGCSADRRNETNISKAPDSPTEGLKIVADDD